MKTPNILFVGGSKGSWAVRGHQVAEALGARATAKPRPTDWQWADVVVLVKHAIDAWGDYARASGVPLIWDVLDYWKQPEENAHSVADLANVVAQRSHVTRISARIAATRAMGRDINGVYIPHHSRPGLAPSKAVRQQVEVVAYEGTPKYLGSWRSFLEEACERRGWRFIVNPTSLVDADIVVALRDEPWDGIVCRRWKSGVKYVNALAAGRPVITQPSSAGHEIGGIAVTVSGPGDLDRVLDRASSLRVRAAAQLIGMDRAHEFELSTIADQYRTLVADVLADAA